MEFSPRIWLLIVELRMKGKEREKQLRGLRKEKYHIYFFVNKQRLFNNKKNIAFSQ